MEDKENYFFAINVPEEVTPALRLAQDHLPRTGIRYSLTNYFHVTLKFLGELSELEAMQVELKAKEVAEHMKFAPDDLIVKFAKPGLFFQKGQPSVVWVGAYLPPALLDFQRNLGEAMEKVGFAMGKKRFKPHITLARIRDIKGSSLSKTEEIRHLGVQKRSFKVSSFYLMKSHLTPHRAPRYKVIHEYQIGD